MGKRKSRGQILPTAQERRPVNRTKLAAFNERLAAEYHPALRFLHPTKGWRTKSARRMQAQLAMREAFPHLPMDRG